MTSIVDQLAPLKLKMHPSIQLASGDYFDFLDPDSTPLDPRDIAHGLSRICRYTGHVRALHYSVAQHTVIASRNCDKAYAFEVLMHDAAESVIGDIASPLKQLLPDYKVIEARVERSILTPYGLPVPMSDECKRIDLVMLATEKRDLMANDEGATGTWEVLRHYQPLPERIFPWDAEYARMSWLRRFNELCPAGMEVAGVRP